jgi:DNA-binding CsgD family transcriptional regulator
MKDLSPRQREILALVAAGRTSKEIASVLGISESTVNWHLANVFARLGASSRAEAVALALREEASGGDRPPNVSPTSARLPTIAFALALMLLVLGILAGALIAGWTIAWP